MADETQEQRAKYYDGMSVLLGKQIEIYKKLDEAAPKEMRLAALGVLGMAQSFAIVSFDSELLEEIAKVRSDLIASLQPKLETTAKNKPQHFQIFYSKRPLEIPFLTPDFFLESDYHDLGEIEANRLEVVYSLLNDPKDKAFIARCEALATHDALSVGDVVKDSANRYWLCQMLGWKEVLPL